MALFFAIPLAASVDSTLPTVVVFGLFLVSIVALMIGNSPLSVTKHCAGEFWISGCSQDFLAMIESQSTT
jgi:hypothetical protein